MTTDVCFDGYETSNTVTYLPMCFPFTIGELCAVLMFLDILSSIALL